MALDTRNKRASAIGIAIAARLVLPAADGAISSADRAHLAYGYAGIQAGSPVPAPDGVVVVEGALRAATVTEGPLVPVAVTAAALGVAVVSEG